MNQSSARYMILKTEDAHALAQSPETARDMVISANILSDSGGDIAEIADKLKAMEICCACSIEGQQHSCNSLSANQLGRRLQRLLDRANARTGVKQP